MPLLEDYSDVEVTEPIDGVVLVTRHALSIQPKEDGDMEKYEHIFHTRYHINDKVQPSSQPIARRPSREHLQPSRLYLGQVETQPSRQNGPIRSKAQWHSTSVIHSEATSVPTQ
ncbi:hypothetical protein CR513_49941, partial [Mucuna pruriens]